MCETKEKRGSVMRGGKKRMSWEKCRRRVQRNGKVKENKLGRKIPPGYRRLGGRKS